MTLEELGREMTRQREEQGLSIEEMARRVKISGRTLRAIEAGTLEALPHTVYAKGFIRSYGVALRMAPQDVNECLEEIFPSEMFDDAKPEPGPLYRAEPAKGTGARVAAILVLLLFVAAVVGGGGYLLVNHGQTPLTWVKQLFSAGNGGDSSTGNATTPDRATTAPAVTPPAQPAEGAPHSERSSSPAQNADTNAPAPLASEGGRAETVAPAPAAPVAAETPRREARDGNEMIITARSDCWVGYKADGTREEVGYTVRKGETYSLTWKKNITVRLGNPSGVSVTVNDKDFTFPHSSNRTAEFSLP